MSSEAICLVIDVGAFASRQPPEGASFLNASLECASMFVERKLFSESKDVIGIVLFGTEETDNPQEYEYVKIVDRGFCQADWETIKFLRDHVEGTRVEADWVDALVVALDSLKRETDEKKFSALKIVLFSDLGCEANSEQKDIIIQGMKLLDGIDITHIGPKQLVEHIEGEEDWTKDLNDDWSDDETPKPGPSNTRGEPVKPREKPLTNVQKENQKVLNDIIAETSGSMFSLDDAVAAFFFKNKKGRKPWPWKVLLEVGPDIQISTIGYIRVRRELPKSWKRCLASGNSTGNTMELQPESVYIRNNEQQECIEPEDTVVAYSYGTDVVTITAQDEETCKFDGGEKSMTVFGFVDRDQVEMSDLIGKGCMVFLSAENDESSALALSVLAQAMQEMGVVAIVRKVYSRRTSPQIGVLAPEQSGDEGGGVYLTYVDLPFMEDRRSLQFPPLDDPRRPLSEEQSTAMDELIDNLDLEAQSAEDVDRTAFIFEPEEELNPQYQYMFQAISSRALHPGRPLPDVPPALSGRLSMPAELRERAAPIMERLRSLFPIEEVEKQKTKRTGDKVFGDKEEANESEPERKKSKPEDNEEEEPSVYCVGSVSPAQDFNYLLSRCVSTGITLQSVGLQMEEVVDRFLASAFGTDLNAKIISCLKAYREACVERNQASLYNNFLKNVKEKAGKKLWTDICDSEVGLILTSEASSGAEKVEADLFLQLHTEDSGDAKEEEDDEDMMDLL